MSETTGTSAANGAHAADYGAPTAAGRPDVDDETLAAAVAVANIPTLLMVLVIGAGASGRNEAGRIVVNSPWRNVDYFDMTSEADLDDCVCEPRAADRELIAD